MTTRLLPATSDLTNRKYTAADAFQVALAVIAGLSEEIISPDVLTLAMFRVADFRPPNISEDDFTVAYTTYWNKGDVVIQLLKCFSEGEGDFMAESTGEKAAKVAGAGAVGAVAGAAAAEVAGATGVGVLIAEGAGIGAAAGPVGAVAGAVLAIAGYGIYRLFAD
jgi:hypothetical protein